MRQAGEIIKSITVEKKIKKSSVGKGYSDRKEAKVKNTGTDNYL